MNWPTKVQRILLGFGNLFYFPPRGWLLPRSNHHHCFWPVFLVSQSWPWMLRVCGLCKRTLCHVRTKQALAKVKSTLTISKMSTVHMSCGWAGRRLTVSQSFLSSTEFFWQSGQQRVWSSGSFLKTGLSRVELVCRPPTGNPPPIGSMGCKKTMN